MGESFNEIKCAAQNIAKAKKAGRQKLASGGTVASWIPPNGEGFQANADPNQIGYSEAAGDGGYLNGMNQTVRRKTPKPPAAAETPTMPGGTAPKLKSGGAITRARQPNGKR